VQEPGSIGYFSEGTRYTQHGEGRSRTLLLQVGGASGSGYMGFDALQRGIATLRSCGTFADGVFTWTDENGTKRNQDGYEAVWEHVHGRAIEYPQPRYQAPVILEPEHFLWIDVAAGVKMRRLGQFNERGLGISQWSVDADAQLALSAATRCD
jgi:hypothetical protein